MFLKTAGRIWAVRYKQKHGASPASEWVPSPGWLDAYCARMAKRGEPLRLRRVKVRNAKGPTRAEADQWFAFLRATLIDIGIMVEGRSQEWMRSRIINIDETGAERLDAKHLRVIVPPHKEGTLALFKQSSDHVTLVGAVDANGERLPPFIILKGKRSPLDLHNVAKRTKGTPANTGWACSENGWITSHIWFNVLEWLVAMKSPTKENPLLVIADCHSTRFNPSVLQWALEHHCHVFTLPRNATSIMQPLDVGVFSAVKTALRQLMTDHAVAQVAIDKTSIPLLLCRAWETGATKTNILAGWRKCGMGVIDHNMSTINMPSHLFCTIIASSSVTEEKKEDNETWKPPHDLANILRFSANERKAAPPRSM